MTEQRSMEQLTNDILTLAYQHASETMESSVNARPMGSGTSEEEATGLKQGDITSLKQWLSDVTGRMKTQILTQGTINAAQLIAQEEQKTFDDIARHRITKPSFAGLTIAADCLAEALNISPTELRTARGSLASARIDSHGF